MSRPRVVIVGAGFAGLAAARALRDRPWHRARVDVTVVDCRNHHVFTPFLYQVAAALLEPPGAAQPVRDLVRRLPNVTFRLARVTGLNLTLRRVETDAGPIGYDYLILAAGAVNDYSAHCAIAARSLGLSDLSEALNLRDHLLSCFEAASSAAGDPARRARLLTFAVVGGGPTGVEFCAALAVLTAKLAGRDFPGIGTAEPRIIMVEASAAPLGSFAAGLPRAAAAGLREAAAAGLRARGVEIRLGTEVTDADADGLTVAGGGRIEAATVVWAAGVRANSLADALPVTGSHGRVVVGPALQVARHREIFVAGDMAQMPGRAGPLPMLAHVAIQSGCRAARSVLALCAGGKARHFRYRDLGIMAATGRGDAVAQLGQWHLTGRPGWMAWLGMNIARTAVPEARARVILGWARGFVFGVRPARIITRSGPPQSSRHGQGSARSGLAGTAAGPVRDPGRPARAGLPSVNVGNANDYGRIAALSWWTQDLPGRKRPPGPPPGTIERIRTRVRRLRNEAFGIKSQTRARRSTR